MKEELKKQMLKTVHEILNSLCVVLNHDYIETDIEGLEIYIEMLKIRAKRASKIYEELRKSEDVKTDTCLHASS